MTQEDTTLDNGRLKRVVNQYDQFNNETSITEYDFGTAGSGSPGPILRQMARTYLTTNHGYCYTSLNALDNTCGTGIATDYKNIIHARRLVVSETISDGANIQEASTSLEYDNYDPTVTSHAAVVTNTGMTGYQDLFSPYDTRFQPRANRPKSRIR